MLLQLARQTHHPPHPPQSPPSTPPTQPHHTTTQKTEVEEESMWKEALASVAAAATTAMPPSALIVKPAQQLLRQGAYLSITLHKRLGPLRAVLTFVLIVLALESRRQQRHLTQLLHQTLVPALERWLEHVRELGARLVRRKDAYRLWKGGQGGKPFAGVFFWGGAGDAGGADTVLAATRDGEDGPFTRRVMLGDRGRARCSWMLRQQFLNETYCDVTFVVEGRAFPAHRCWVAAFSKPLCAMFNSGMRESQQSRITLEDTDAAAFELMLGFIYGGPVELNQDNIECVLELSVRFAVGMLIEQCCNFLASAVAVDTACAILILADKYDCRPLRRDTLLYVVAHLPRCWATGKEAFARLPRPLLLEVLSHDALTHGEIVAFHTAVFWLEEWRRGQPVEQDELEKLEEARLVEEVLGHVRFPHMPARLLVEQVEGHPIMQAEACQKFVLEAYRYQAVLQEQSSRSQEQQQELLRKYGEEMGIRARPRRKLSASQSLVVAGSSSNCSSGSSTSTMGSSSGSEWPALEDEEAWARESVRRQGPTTAAIMSTTTSKTITNHNLVGRVEEIEPQVLGENLRLTSGTVAASYSLVTTTSSSTRTSNMERRREHEEV